MASYLVDALLLKRVVNPPSLVRVVDGVAFIPRNSPMRERTLILCAYSCSLPRRNQMHPTKAKAARPVSVVVYPQPALPSHARDLPASSQGAAAAAAPLRSSRHQQQQRRHGQQRQRPVSLIAVTTSNSSGAAVDVSLLPPPRGSPPPVYSPRT